MERERRERERPAKEEKRENGWSKVNVSALSSKGKVEFVADEICSVIKSRLRNAYRLFLFFSLSYLYLFPPPFFVFLFLSFSVFFISSAGTRCSNGNQDLGSVAVEQFSVISSQDFVLHSDDNTVRLKIFMKFYSHVVLYTSTAIYVIL